MSRLQMPSAMPADRAEVLSDIGPELTAHEQALIEQLAEQNVTQRLYDSTDWFADLMDGIESHIYLPQLQRALAHIERACKGDRNALDAVTSSLSQIKRVVKGEADRLWLSDMKDEAEAEIMGIEQ